MTISKIKAGLNRLEFAAAVVEQLSKHDITCVLVGGSCVSIYTHEKYVSDDLDFISPFSQEAITKALTEIGFAREGRYYTHKNSNYYVEFPSGPITIGNKTPVTPEEIITINGINIHLLSPTQSVMDRLAAWYHWNDRRSLLQAIDIIKENNVSLNEIEDWSKEEGKTNEYHEFVKQLTI